MEQSYDEKMAVFHILQIVEQGRPHEVAAQFMASWLMSGDLDQDEIVGFHADLAKIRNRMEYLCFHPEEIWDGLLPGGPGSIARELGIVNMDDWLKAREGLRIAERILEAVSPDISDEERMEKVSNIFIEKGWVTHGIVDREKSKPDPYMYTISIMLDPNVTFGSGESKFVAGPFRELAESVLNLAAPAEGWMGRASSNRGIPEEELVVWITHDESKTDYVMTIDQRDVIIALNVARETLAGKSIDTDFLDEEFQGVQDQMAIAGQEYAGNGGWRR